MRNRRRGYRDDGAASPPGHRPPQRTAAAGSDRSRPAHRRGRRELSGQNRQRVETGIDLGLQEGRSQSDGLEVTAGLFKFHRGDLARVDQLAVQHDHLRLGLFLLARQLQPALVGAAEADIVARHLCGET